MVQVCPGTHKIHVTPKAAQCGEPPHRVRRAVLMALLFGLMFLPIFLEVTRAFEPQALEDKKKASLLASRKTLDFGKRPVGVPTPIVSLAIANSSGSDVPISKVSIDGANAEDFSLVSSTCESLAPNASCTIVTRFTPKATGARSARLVVTRGGKGEGLEVPLVGNGLDPAARRSRRSARSYR
jgi:hypothetical protein